MPTLSTALFTHRLSLMHPLYTLGCPTMPCRRTGPMAASAQAKRKRDGGADAGSSQEDGAAEDAVAHDPFYPLLPGGGGQTAVLTIRDLEQA